MKPLVIDRTGAVRSPYETLLRHVLVNGDKRSDRTGVGTIGVFGTQSRYDLADSFPLVTTKKLFTKAIFVELCWMMKGMNSLEYLHEHGVKIWDEWADANGELGPIYGQQWRSWPGQSKVTHEPWGTSVARRKIDQLALVIEDLKAKPFDRGHVVSAWNPEFLDKMALRPCHTLFQFYSDGVHLYCQLYQRSGDLFLCVPFNIASYSALTYVVGHLTGLKPREFIHTIGDAHIYSNHIEQVKLQLTRDAKPFPTMSIVAAGERLDPRDFEPRDFHVTGYDPHPAIKGEVAV